MLLRFWVSNYRSFRERQILNMAAGKADQSFPQNLIRPELSGLKGRQGVKGVGIYGAIASGETTLPHAS